MELNKVIQERCCIRQFTNQKPTKDQLKEIIEAGRLAPSWVNVQPWHFIAVQDEETIKLLGELTYNQPHVQNANTLIVCCGTLDSWELENFKQTILSRPNVSEEKLNRLMSSPVLCPKLLDDEAVKLRTLEEVTYAVAYMTLEIENQGLAGCIIGGMGNPLTRNNLDVHEKVCEKLNLPDNTMITTILVVGYPDEQKPPKIRKEFNQVASFNKYGEKF
ncbi:MAG: nitroreductase family protein [Vampirovibrionia bacterium]